MKVNRAYKLNKEKQPAEESGKFLYYFYNNHKLDSIAVDEEQWGKLVELDTEMYNGYRRHKDHSVKLTDNVKPAVDDEKGFLHSKKFDSEDDFLRKKDIENLLLREFDEQDRKIKQAVIYARFSSHSQTEQSIEGQPHECYDFAKRSDITIVGEYIDRALRNLFYYYQL